MNDEVSPAEPPSSESPTTESRFADSPFAEPRRLDPRGIAVEAIGVVRQSAGTYGIAAVIALVSGRALMVVGIALVVVGVVAALSLLRWLRRTYYLHDGALVVDGGVIQRSTTTVPLERVQGVSIEQQLAQRLFGVVRVAVDTAGTGSDEVDLSALSRPDAEALRRAILGGRTGVATSRSAAVAVGDDAVVTDIVAEVSVDSPAGPAAAAPVPTTLLHRSVNELLVVGLTRNPLRLAAAALGSFFAFGDDLFGRTAVDEQATDLLPDGVAGVIAIVGVVAGLLVVASSVAAVIRWYDLTLDVSGGPTAPSYSVRYGLLDKRERNAPDQRVQVVTAIASPAERLVGRLTVRLAPAGAQGEDSDNGSAVTLPGSTPAELAAILRSHLGSEGPDADRPISNAIVWRRTMWIGGLFAVLAIGGGTLGAVADVGLWWVSLPAGVLAVGGVWWHARALWRSWCWGWDGEVIITAHGVVGTRTGVARIHKLQAVELRQGLFERRRRLASISMRTAAGTMDIPYLELDTARRVRDELLAVAELSDEPWM